MRDWGFAISVAGLAIAMFMKAWLVVVTMLVVAGAPLDQKSVEYAHPNGHPLFLDLHVPDGPGPFPAAILVHGGGFDGGSRATNMSPTFEPLPDAGFA
jgi:acetyl esterase